MVLNDVIVEDIAIVSCHLQGGVSHESLKGERIAATVNQILSGEGVSKRMEGSSFHTPGIVVLYDCQSQGVLTQEVPELIAKEIIRRRSCPNCHVIPKDGNHGRTKRNDLNLTVLGVSENDLLACKVYILDLDVSHCSRPTATVQKKVNNNPVSILTEITVGFWLFQKDQKLFVSIGFLHSLRSLVQFDVQA